MNRQSWYNYDAPKDHHHDSSRPWKKLTSTTEMELDSRSMNKMSKMLPMEWPMAKQCRIFRMSKTKGMRMTIMTSWYYAMNSQPSDDASRIGKIINSKHKTIDVAATAQKLFWLVFLHITLVLDQILSWILFIYHFFTPNTYTVYPVYRIYTVNNIFFK